MGNVFEALAVAIEGLDIPLDGFAIVDALALRDRLDSHHHRLHQPGWHATLAPDGTFEVTEPTGRVRNTSPPRASRPGRETVSRRGR